MTDEALRRLSPKFEALYATTGRPSVPPEHLLRALLLQVLYSVRSERLLMEQLQYNPLFRWFVGLDMDDPVWTPTTFGKNRDRLLDGDIWREVTKQMTGLLNRLHASLRLPPKQVEHRSTTTSTCRSPAGASWPRIGSMLRAVMLARWWPGSAIGLTALVACEMPSAPTAAVGSAAPRSNGPTVLAGHVIDFKTNNGVPTATIGFTDADLVLPPKLSTISDAAGSYQVALQSLGLHYVFVNGSEAGMMRVPGSGYRGDLFVHADTCVARYGIISDGFTLRPIVGATVSLFNQSTTTASDGWYRIDLGCPATGLVGFNTTFMYIHHPSYPDRAEGVGRGVSGVERRDVWLSPSAR
jgi:hypothetical protein